MNLDIPDTVVIKKKVKVTDKLLENSVETMETEKITQSVAEKEKVKTEAPKNPPQAESCVHEPVKNRAFIAPSLAQMTNVESGGSEILDKAKDATPENLTVIKNKIEKTEHTEVYVELDKRDEAQVSGEIVGAYIQDFVYEYCKRHKWPDGKRGDDCKCSDTIRDLSWLGIQEASRSMEITVMAGTTWVIFDKDNKASFSDISKIDDPGIIIHEFPDKIRITVRVYDPYTKMVRIGVAEQKKLMHTQYGVKDDEFYQQKAMSKAQRNALRQLLPQTKMRMWIDKFLLDKNGSASVVPTISCEKLDKLFEVIETENIEVSKEYVKQLVHNDVRADYVLGQIEANGVKGLREWIKPQGI